jgi:hypothetical protein
MERPSDLCESIGIWVGTQENFYLILKVGNEVIADPRYVFRGVCEVDLIFILLLRCRRICLLVERNYLCFFLVLLHPVGLYCS